MLDISVSTICFILTIVCVLVSVAFMTLLERKVLGYIQIRKGPNKVALGGIMQPFSDAIKLFTKEQTYPLVSNYLFFYFSPVMSLFVSLTAWMCIPISINAYSFEMGILFFFCCTSMGVYSVMSAGWSSNSNYALLGGLRAVAQTISYEVSLALVILSLVILVESYSLVDFFKFQEASWFMLIAFPLAIVWFCISLAETNRTPFDFAEGESELVSGFNVEYSSGGFALIFLAEYASILLMSILYVILFLGGDLFSLFFFMKFIFVAFSFIWVRGTLPRFRYDKLMYVAWKCFLPLALNFLVFFIGLKLLILS